MWTEKESQVLDMLLTGIRWVELEKLLGVSRDTVKRRIYRMCRKIGLPRSTVSYVALVAYESYRRRPDLIPFANGDRAQEVGAVSAQDFATIKLAISAYREKRHEPDIQKSSDHLSEACSQRNSDERRAR